ncbi:MAG TPA: SpoVA/SpoVAEb family sporulation membrane protein [Clostridiales bacterium]|nr:SpoVA/SpoVAEb family sporulation membrane protein [Clostridiales bacterium]
MMYIKVFIIGGLLCVLAEILIIKTKLTSARILVIFLIVGVILEAIGVFKYLKEFAGAGFTVPIIGFGSSLAKGAIEAVNKEGFLGMFSGGIFKTAAGLGAVTVFSYLSALIFSPKSK